MAARGVQYIFGEFSADEFNRFFTTPRSYVELPPVLDKVSCVNQSSGEAYERICFGVDEPMGLEPLVLKDSTCKVSSTLNPQAPEFIAGCQAVPKSLSSLQDGNGVDFSTTDGVDLEGGPVLGGLEQRERKKKKKRPPGYYSYLEGSGSSSMIHAKVAGLVNGHTSVTPTESEDMLAESRSEPSACSPGNSLPSDAVEASADTGSRRTCDSHIESSPHMRITSSSDSNDATNSSSSSDSGGAAEGVRTAGAPAPENSEVLCGARQCPGPACMPTIPTASALRPHVARAADEPVNRGPNNQAALNGPGVSCEVEELQPRVPQQVAENASGETWPGGVPTASSIAPSSAVSQLKSWASLFHNSKPLPVGLPAYVGVKNIPAPVPGAATTAPAVEQVREVNESHPVHVTEDPLAPRLADLIENVKLIHKPVSLQPRGLINKGNWCYINATLQALVACPPMYHLMKSLPIVSEMQASSSSTPMINNFVRLVSEFSNMPVPPKAKTQVGDKMMKDIRAGVPFEPDYIYRLLTVIKSSLSEKGRQEDAEEYLGYILNGLHEEMLALKKLLSPQEGKASTLNGPVSQPRAQEDMAERQEEGSDDEWEQVGPRNKTSVTRQADFIRTPITDIFGGHIRSVVYQQSSKESATLQLFFTLQLDIQSEKIHTVQEALESLVARESVHGYTSRTKQEIEISRRVTLEELPPVLVLHLKRFVFEKSGGCQKLVKNVDYPVDLEISRDLLSPGVRSKIFKGQRTYRLFAVVYHHGNSATGGHYTTDVFHIGLNGWLRIDDQTVKVVSQQQVLKQNAERTAYLLYYRRVDLL
ncbi:ubiquitin carboxyl-terminal hydrolase 10-like [Scleropages formosus]|uniref:Ubiquitin carboxyl-terminal hydrolase n=1 Tax=Scleropages formosus TaxID=113540 RepID=A0A0N8K0U3_SCLFO|nr:ubiquitin carboxyl-terminal hydrolase 10-like [Scleropages formosus]